ncbi:MAG: hypothetical protein WA632_06970, partial [Gallionella sp.]
MPLLFFLDEMLEGWINVSEAEIRSLGLFPCPLPLNLFRHRFSRKLRHVGVDPEVVDSLMGHVDGGVPTHDYYSLRTWFPDIERARPLIDELFRALHFDFAPGCAGAGFDTPVKNQGTAKITGKDLRRVFGVELRRQKRRESREFAERDADLLIAQELAKINLEDPDDEAIDRLVDKLYFNPRGTPHPRGFIRVERLFLKLDQLWRERGKKLAVRKRFVQQDEVSSPFHDSAPGTLNLFQATKDVLARVTTDMLAAKTNFRDATVLGAVHLLVETRIASRQIVDAVLHDRDFRLIYTSGRYYLEYSKFFARKEHPPVQRFPISVATAALLNLARSALRHTFRENMVIPGVLGELRDLWIKHGRIRRDTNALAFLDALRGAVEQANLMQCPGIVAGYLNGELESYSLSWQDMLRMETGEIIEPPVQAKDPAAIGVAAAGAVMPKPVHQRTRVDTPTLQLGAHTLMKAVDKLLSDNVHAGPTAFVARKDLCGKIQALVKQYRHETSTAIQMLALWAKALVMRRKRGQELIKVSTVIRYLDALAPPFEGVG